MTAVHVMSAEHSTLTTNDIHNFSTIVKPHHESEEDRSLPQAENDTAISGQFSIFDDKR